MENKKQYNLTKILFGVYILILIWILLFKMSFSFEELHRSRSINIIPFAGTGTVSARIHMSELINNILVFVPIGIYTCILKQEWSILNKISIAFFISFGIEVLQFILAIGITDITDIIGNTMGGVIGIGIFYLFTKIFKSKATNILKILASTATIGLVGLLSILLLFN